MALTGMGTIRAGLLLAVTTAYTGTVRAWIDSIVVLVVVGLAFTSGARLVTPTGALSGGR